MGEIVQVERDSAIGLRLSSLHQAEIQPVQKVPQMARKPLSMSI
jgi:hypothetical protein